MYSNSLIDFHIHTIASDGTDSPQALLANLRQAGIHTFAVTDHDTIQGALEVERLLHETGNCALTFHRGVEFSAQFFLSPSAAKPCKVHILGYDYDPEVPTFRSLLEEGSAKRREKLRVRLNHLQSLGFNLPQERIDRLYTEVLSGKSIGKPHLALELIHNNLVPEEERSLNIVIPKYLSGIPIPNERVDAFQAIHAIREAGGIAVWAHPLGGEGEPRISFEECVQQLQCLWKEGLQGLECHYSRYTPEECHRLTELAHAYNLRISGGSDYHGTNKNIALGTLNCERIPVSENELTLF